MHACLLGVHVYAFISSACMHACLLCVHVYAFISSECMHACVPTVCACVCIYK